MKSALDTTVKRASIAHLAKVRTFQGHRVRIDSPAVVRDGSDEERTAKRPAWVSTDYGSINWLFLQASKAISDLTGSNVTKTHYIAVSRLKASD